MRQLSGKIQPLHSARNIPAKLQSHAYGTPLSTAPTDSKPRAHKCLLKIEGLIHLILLQEKSVAAAAGWQAASTGRLEPMPFFYVQQNRPQRERGRRDRLSLSLQKERE